MYGQRTFCLGETCSDELLMVWLLQVQQILLDTCKQDELGSPQIKVAHTTDLQTNAHRLLRHSKLWTTRFLSDVFKYMVEGLSYVRSRISTPMATLFYI
jgi:hypothetical protein